MTPINRLRALIEAASDGAPEVMADLATLREVLGVAGTNYNEGVGARRRACNLFLIGECDVRQQI